MKKIFPIAVSLCLLFGLSFAAFAQDKTVDKKDVEELKKIYQEFDAAAKNRDISIVEKYLDENYEIESSGEKVNRAETIARLKQFFAMTTEISEAVSKIEKVKVADGNYFLETSGVIKGKLKMPDGSTASFEMQIKSTDVWIKTEDGWKENTQIDRGSKMLINGKEVPM
jgi:ketosteroid isomerase-like protein